MAPMMQPCVAIRHSSRSKAPGQELHAFLEIKIFDCLGLLEKLVSLAKALGCFGRGSAPFRVKVLNINERNNPGKVDRS